MDLSKAGSQIRGERLYLRVLTEGDASREYCGWLNDPEVNKYLETKEATVEDLKQYIREKSQNPASLLLGIFLLDDDRHIGNIKLEPIDFRGGKATLGLMVGDKGSWGKGYGSEAVRLLADYAQKSLGIKEIDLCVKTGNKAAIKVYKKAGFFADSIKGETTHMVKKT